MPEAKVLECLLCVERYSREDVRRGFYQAETMICSACYARMQAAPYGKSCFGKPTIVEPVEDYAMKILERGFDLSSTDCRCSCPDKEICRKVFEV